jgi:oligosaccharide reducing-end xylanase
MAYIANIGSSDVRSEGISYGMMIAVQLNKQEEFNRLWQWANRYMRHADGPLAGYFAWQCKFDGTQMDHGSASDGEEWMAMALFFAAHRWDSTQGIFNYEAEAQRLLRDMLHKPATTEVTPIFNRAEKQVVFCPNPDAGTLTDPSYHLPFFYDLWARWSHNADDRTFWAEAATTSRAYFHKATHPVTGLMPEYSHFDGSPFTDTRFGTGKGDFRSDAFRTIPHVALDHAWFAADPWQIEQGNRVLRFLKSLEPVIPDRIALDGTPLSKSSSAGMIAVCGVAGLTAEPDLARPFVQRLWDMPVPSGKWRYYDGLLYLLSLLEAGGKFQIHVPAKLENTSSASVTTPIATKPPDSLRQGMTATQVRQLLGEPKSIKPFKSGELKSDVWTYERVISKTTDQIQTGSREVPLMNPRTGVMGTTQEPVYGLEFTTVTEILELLVIEDHLIQWKRKNLVDRKHD